MGIVTTSWSAGNSSFALNPLLPMAEVVAKRGRQITDRCKSFVEGASFRPAVPVRMAGIAAACVGRESARRASPHGAAGGTMTMREIAQLREESMLKRPYRALLTSGEALTCTCWGLLLLLCVLQETVETLMS
jgi:hypothetical protein